MGAKRPSRRPSASPPAKREGPAIFPLCNKESAQIENWTVLEDGKITTPYQNTTSFTKVSCSKTGKFVPDVDVSFDNGKTHCFSTEAKNRQKVVNFLKYIQSTMSSDSSENRKSWNIKDVLEKLTSRRRMAQREFSDRRDSPVMVRLLEEIVA